MSEDESDEVYDETYGAMIDRLVDKIWVGDTCCVDCGRLIDGEPEKRWAGETEDGRPLFDPVCPECV